jgi:O-antigen ligase
LRYKRLRTEAMRERFSTLVPTASHARAGELPSTGVSPVGPTPFERGALRILQIGAVAVVLAVSTDTVFELDRFFVPKELVLHLTAFAAGLLALNAVRRRQFTRVDFLLLGFLGLSTVSALGATNPWAAARALAISVSSVCLFWVAGAVREAGLQRPLLRALAIAVVLGAGTSLLQAYGLQSDFFSVNRAPGGTLGNRNFIAHMAAMGLPLVLVVALRAWRPAGYLLGGVGVMFVVTSLVLTRSRGGWLAFGAVMLVFVAAMLTSRPLRRHFRTWLRFGGILLLIGGGVVTALLAPNSLQWRSDNPYLESVTGIANYQDGSGRGRLVQYRQSLGMAVQYPLLGVGPGNWPVEYPRHAEANDPSLSPSTAGTTSNPWPSSDWIAYVAERGFPAALLLAMAMIGIAGSAARRIVAARDEDEALLATALLAMALAAVVAGVFDAVLLLGLPALLFWTGFGALRGSAPLPPHSHSYAMPLVVLLVVCLAAGLASARSAAQLAAMRIFATSEGREFLERAARLDPGNYRIRLRLAQGRSGGDREERCAHARAAHALFPNAAAARELNRGCGQ